MNKFQKETKKIYIYLTLTIAIMVIIFAFSSQSAVDSNEVSGSALVWIAENIIRKPQISASLFAMKLIRKIAHFSVYLCLGVSSALTVREWNRTKEQLVSQSSSMERKAETAAGNSNSRKRFLCAWIIPVIYACTDEFHQYFVPGRSSELRDVLIDGMGALTGVICVWLIGAYRARLRDHDKKKDTP